MNTKRWVAGSHLNPAANRRYLVRACPNKQPSFEPFLCLDPSAYLLPPLRAVTDRSRFMGFTAAELDRSAVRSSIPTSHCFYLLELPSSHYLPALLRESSSRPEGDAGAWPKRINVSSRFERQTAISQPAGVENTRQLFQPLVLSDCSESFPFGKL